MFLDYLALAILLMGLTLVFYTFIYIHDLPYKIAKERNHPHAEAIHVACWLSLFTLHAMWPLVFTWAVTKKKGLDAAGGLPHLGLNGEVDRRIAALEERLHRLEGVAK